MVDAPGLVEHAFSGRALRAPEPCRSAVFVEKSRAAPVSSQPRLPFGFSHHYCKVMGEKWGIAFLWACTAGFLVGMAFVTPASAQPIADDAAAREYFKAGRVAFDQADYESALTYFRHAYRTSGRGALLYNIGVAADRLQRDQEALEAFEQYLDKTEKPERESEVRRRIEALQKSIAENDATARALMEAELRYQQGAQGSGRATRDPAPVPTSASIGATESPLGGVAFRCPSTLSQSISRPPRRRKSGHGSWPLLRS